MKEKRNAKPRPHRFQQPRQPHWWGGRRSGDTLIPLSIEICQRAIAGGTPTVGLYNSTDTADIFANANTGASGVPVRNSTRAGTAPYVVNQDDIVQVRVTTGGGVTATGVMVILTYLSTGDPANR